MYITVAMSSTLHRRILCQLTRLPHLTQSNLSLIALPCNLRGFHTSKTLLATEVPHQPAQTKLPETRLRRFWCLVSVEKSQSFPPSPVSTDSRWLYNLPRLQTTPHPGRKRDRPSAFTLYTCVPHWRRMECRYHPISSTTYTSIDKSCLPCY